ncbi:MAG: hypothetical protein PHG02_04805 [Oscillospiraceae bacterium]|nr:hypothetical protein [Oscillospiraceae bacterium]
MSQMGQMSIENTVNQRLQAAQSLHTRIMATGAMVAQGMPATTFLLPTGTYAKDVLPIEAEIVQSVAVTQGEAVIGMGHKYFLGMGTSKDGKIEYDDSVHFLEDERVYIIKLLGNGFPIDHYAFLLLDISGLKPTNQRVAIEEMNAEVTVAEVKGTVKTKEQTT